MIRIIVVGLAILIGTGILVIIVGYALPKAHRASCSASYAHSPQALWEIVTNRGDASWRTDVKHVELLSPGGDQWTETNAGGDVIRFQVEEALPPGRLVTRIADETLPFGGSWTYELEGDETVTRLTITEDGEVYNPIFRFVSHFFMDSTATIRTYLNDLGEHLGDATEIDCEK